MPLIDGFDDESILSVGHLGIVAGAYDSLGIANIIDTAIPKTRNHNLTHSQVVKAMVLNGLGFIERRLYLFPEFFDDIAVERLLGEGITREQINDDVLGRTLDAIAEYGPTELFNEIVANCLLRTEFGSHCVHVDTTNFSVTGEYESDFNTEEIQITYGHPKDGRWDLKRFVLGMASNQHGVPLFLQTFSGNESDKETLRIIIEKLQSNLKSEEKVYHVADAAFYTEKNLQSLGRHMFWISRVPVTIKDVKELIKSDFQFTPCVDERYSYSEYFSEYAGIRQKWVMYHSEPMHEQQNKTFQKNLVKDLERAKTSLRKVCAQEFACEPDARIAAEKWLDKHPEYLFSELEILTVQRKEEKKRGRPKAGEPLVHSYKITADIEYDDSVVEQERQNLGRFVLATNDTGMSADELLANYKGQGSVERGFRFLKDKSFRVAEVFLKKPSRIQALAMIMVLCLFIYSMTEFRLRRELGQSGETVTSQTKKQTQRPTMKWTFFLFRRVREFSFVEGERRIKRITNLNDELKKILRLLGGEYEKYYC
ncbi:IS1634 family transposase [Methanogenium sp. S4BF]|uniref:IS1634 family transposase n=1 Tax=Methanogenium sp. S4BF TaxID=1789226 RepID=UPI002416ADEC|nr:IS1634 family transposase [Methanogenium sp. S4BF]WFN33986.1 IS1634 family transposase [Methanogenium sp. S4BF]WFN35032.1 IS1634 family transposase [Methanogenium sp. S4BF]